MTNKENKFLYIAFAISFGAYALLLWNYSTIFEIFMSSLITTYFVKSIYDIKNKTGYDKMYCYSDITNQRLRYLTSFVITIFFIGNLKFLTCTKLQLFTCSF